MRPRTQTLLGLYAPAEVKMTIREYALFSVLPAIVLAGALSFTIFEHQGDNAAPVPAACPTAGPVPGSCDDLRLRLLKDFNDEDAYALLWWTCRTDPPN